MSFHRVVVAFDGSGSPGDVIRDACDGVVDLVLIMPRPPVSGGEAARSPEALEAR